MMKTLTVIGGGSAYTPGLLQALIHHHASLELESIALFDIDVERASLVARLCDKLARNAGAPFRVIAHEKIGEALKGADVVLNSSRPGGFECRRIDETLPLEFGVPGQETVGPGGFFFALRSVPVAIELAKALRTYAPHARLLNYTNPTNIVTQALHDEGYRVIGLCDQSEEDLHELGAAANFSARPVFACVGLNHATWYSDVRFGECELPRPTDMTVPSTLHGEYRLRFIRSLELAKKHPGYWPNSYLAYYDVPDRFVSIAKEGGVRTDAIMARMPQYFEHFAVEAAKSVPELKHHRGTEGFGDMAVRVIHSLAADSATSIALNVPNRDTFECFAADTIVEAVCNVSRLGYGAQVAATPPDGEGDLLKRLEAYQRAAAEVAVRGNHQGLAGALAENPLIPSIDVARAMLEQAKRAYGDQIPVFA